MDWSGVVTVEEGHMLLNSVNGRGIASAPDHISGSAAFPEVSSRTLEDRSLRIDNWVGERDDGIADADLGTVVVSWRLDAVE